MHKKKIIIWDFDGVIVPLDFKMGPIWEEVFSENKDLCNSVADFLQTDRGKTVNRYGLIQHALIENGHGELSQLERDALRDNPLVKKYAERYRHAAINGVIAGGVHQGIVEVLMVLQKAGYRHYIISGGGNDHDLTEVCSKLGIEKFFDGIFGFGDPKTPLESFGKMENFKRVAVSTGESDPAAYTVIGDSVSDYHLSQEIGDGCRFVGVMNAYRGWDEYPDIEKIDINEPQRIVDVIMRPR